MKILLIAAILTSHLTFAGQEVGNGGDALVCQAGLPDQTTEILDFFEARTLFGWDQDLGDDSPHPIEKARLALRRFAHLDPERAALYETWLDSFCDETLFLPANIKLTDVNDTGYLEIPQQCTVQQVILQTEPASVFHKRYRISQRFWGWENGCIPSAVPAELELDNNSKAGFILHELVYREAIQRGHKTSSASRMLTGLISSSAATSLSKESYQQAMLESGFRSWSWTRVHVNTTRYQYFDEQPMTQQDAINFCSNLSASSGLVDIANAISLDPNGYHLSALNNRLFKTDPPAIWSSKSAITITKTHVEEVDLSPDEKLPFICFTVIN